MSDNRVYPGTMQAVFLEKPRGRLVVNEVKIPDPEPNEVLIKMSAAPVNPSDLAGIKNAHIEYDLATFIPALPASSLATISHPPMSLLSVLPGNFAIHKFSSLSNILAFGLAPPKDEPGFTSIMSHLKYSGSSIASSSSSLKLICSNSLMEVHRGEAS